MSSEPQKLYLPCSIFTMHALVGPSKTLTHLEKLILRAIRHGADHVRALEGIFKMGARPMLRIVLGMIDRGYLSIDYHSGILRLSHMVAEAIQNGNLDHLDSTDTRSEPVALMYDLVSGTVFRRRAKAQRVQRGYILEPRLSRGSFRKVDKGRLLRVGEEIARRWRTRTDRDIKIMELSLNLQQVPRDASNGEYRLIELEVRVHRDPANGYVRITILHPDDLGALVQRRLEEELTRLINLPEPPLALKNLRDKPDLSPLKGTLDLKGRLSELRKLTQRLEEADQGTLDEWQASLADHAREVVSALAEHSFCHLEHKIVADQGRQAEFIKSIINRSRQQIVLACPFLRYEPMMFYRDAIERAVNNGVRFFLLSGVVSALQEPYELDPGLANWLTDLKERYPGRLYYCENEANVHAKFVIGDASELFVTSYNFLNKSPDAVFELGVWIGPPDTRAQNRRRSTEDLRVIGFPALHALSIAEEVYPHLQDRQRMLVSGVDFGGREPGTTGDGSRWPTRAKVKGADGDIRLQADRLWRKQWQEYAEQLSASFAGLGTTFEIVRDARHRELLYDALRTVKDRLIVLSDRLSARVVNRQFMDELESCIKNGARVVLLCQRPQEGPLRRLRQLERSLQDERLHVLVAHNRVGNGEIGGRSHAKFLIADDMAVVTSFNFLSFAAEDRGPERLRHSTELGLALRGGSAADTILKTLRQRWPEFPVSELEPLDREEGVTPATFLPCPVPVRRDVIRLLRKIAEAIQRLPGKPSIEAQAHLRFAHLRRWFAEAPSVEVALGDMADLYVASPPYIDHVIACFLDRWADHIPPDAAARWNQELIERLWWQRHDAMGVLVLLGSLRSNERRASIPPANIAELTARCELLGGAPSLATDVILEAVEGGNTAAQAAAAALAIPLVVFFDEGPIEALEMLADHLQGGLAGWAKAVLKFRSIHLLGQRKEQLDALGDLEATRARHRELKAELCSQLEKTCRLNLDFKVFKLAWGYLKRGEMGLDRLRKAAEEEDVAYVAAFLAMCGKRYGEGRKAVDRMLDLAVREGASSISQQHRSLYGKYRHLCLDHLWSVMKMARNWVEVAAALGGNVGAADLGALKDLTEVIVADKPAVEQQHRTAAKTWSFEGPLLERMIQNLEPIWRLGGKLA